MVRVPCFRWQVCRVAGLGAHDFFVLSCHSLVNAFKIVNYVRDQDTPYLSLLLFLSPS